MALFEDRREAGIQLAGRLQHLRGHEGLVVLALPRGGVPVAFEVARALDAPLDVLVVRKLGFPGHEEFALGAVASGGVRVLNPQVDALLPQLVLEAVTRKALRELLEREQRYRAGHFPLRLEGREVLLIDDGVATGSTMLAAVAALRQQRPARILVAAPVASQPAAHALQSAVDALIFLATPSPFGAVGRWYREFEPTTDEEVRTLLGRAQHAAAASAPTAR